MAASCGSNVSSVNLRRRLEKTNVKICRIYKTKGCFFASNYDRNDTTLMSTNGESL